MSDGLRREEVQARLSEFVRRELLRAPDEALDPHQALITTGRFDSFALAQVAVFIEEAFGVYVPDTELTTENMDTIAAMADTVLRQDRP